MFPTWRLSMNASCAARSSENCEAELAAEIDSILDEGRLPAPNDLKARFAPDPGKMPRIDVARTHLAGYGSLLSAGGASLSIGFEV